MWEVKAALRQRGYYIRKTCSRYAGRHCSFSLWCFCIAMQVDMEDAVAPIPHSGPSFKYLYDGLLES